MKTRASLPAASPLAPQSEQRRSALRRLSRRLMNRFNPGADMRMLPQANVAHAAGAVSRPGATAAAGAGTLASGAVRAASAAAMGVRPDANAIAAAAAAMAQKQAEQKQQQQGGGSTFLSGGFGWTGSAFGQSGSGGDADLGKGLLTSFEVGSTEEALLTISRTGLTEWDHHCQARHPRGFFLLLSTVGFSLLLPQCFLL